MESKNIPECPGFLVDYLVELANRPMTGNPGSPVKFEPEPEVCLIDYSDASLEEINF